MYEKEKVQFEHFVTGLLAEGMVALGLMENPITKKPEKNMEHATSVISVLEMLQDKTSGNLSVDERNTLEGALHQLRLIFVSESNKPGEGSS